MTTLSPPTPTKPQSIVHKIGRVGSVMKLPFGKQRSQRKLKIRLSKIAKDLFDESELTEHTLDITEHEDSMHDSLGECSLQLEESTSPTVALNEQDEGFFVPLNQNEFLIECFMTNECSDITFIVHFDAEESALSDSIEDVILIRSMEAGSHCQCRRVNARLAPLFTAKLGIDASQPTVLAIRNGTIISRISDISSSGCWELEKWIADTGVLEKKKTSSEFLSLNTLSC